MAEPTPGNYTHVEIITNDVEGAVKFYESAFGWKISRFGPEMNDYVMYETSSGITGGFRKPEQGESPGALTYLSVKDIDAEVTKLTGLGANVVAPKMEIPGWGFMVVLAVPGGTVQALWQSTAPK